MTQFAVIRTGGKQYLVSPGQKIKIDPQDQKISLGAGKIE
ncbi:MAG: bL21 family ribosomal protein, partial [Candidatus Nealsonbacteria bacterium]|nr:bL21 family ribosomal protein [Candidatus Nealsonbacteria bacterium]